MSYQHPTPEQLKQIFGSAKTIAVVGITDKPDRPSYYVSAYMQQAGYTIIPINPRLDKVLGEQVYASLDDVPIPIDIVNVFRRSEETPPFVEAAAKANAKLVWLQLGIYSEEAYEIAAQANLPIIMDRCIKVDHNRYA